MPDVYDFLVDVLGSRVRVKIVLALIQLGESTLTRLVRETGLNHVVVKQGIEYLKRHSIVVEERIGGYVVYRVDDNNPLIVALRDLVEKMTRKER